MIHYIVQVLLCQLIFLVVYDLFLQKETFFKLNRVYLLLTPILSFSIPLLKLDLFKNSLPIDYVEHLPTVFLNPESLFQKSAKIDNSFGLLHWIFIIGAVVVFALFMFRLSRIINLLTKSNIEKREKYNLVLVSEKASVFSFFNYIFIHKDLLGKKDLVILKHELIHCKHYHTIDLLFFEFLKIIMWFNPLIYVFQNRITLLHEYISDAEVIKETDKNVYFNSLLSHTFNTENILFINQYFKQSLIKKRIAMITKNKSQKIKQLKYLLIVPLVGMLLFLSSFEKNVETILDPLPTIITNKVFEDSKASEIQVVADTIIESLSVNKINKSVLKKPDYVQGPLTIPFSELDKAPVFPGCVGNHDEIKECLKESITNHVNKNFNVEISKNLDLKPGINRIFVMFTISGKGNIEDVKIRAEFKELEEEAARVISLLPKMLPGEYKDEVVSVKYALPIAFNVEENLNNLNEKKQPLYILNGKEITKKVIDNIDIDKVKSVNVLKDDQAVKKYGEKGANGVVEMILKEE